MVRRTQLPDVELLHVVAVRHVGEHRLRLRFSDGVEGVADLAAHLNGPMLRPLRDTKVFARARIQDRYTVAWPNDVDVAPEFLYAITSPEGAVAKRNLLRAFDDARAKYAAQCDRMPEISRFFGIIIRMFADEHSPPHFHARYGKHTVTIAVRDGQLKTHSFPARPLRLVQEWHKQHRTELLANWERMRRGESPVAIAPLQ